jgi:hypothetical protein
MEQITRDELRELAKEKQVKGWYKMTKAELISALVMEKKDENNEERVENEETIPDFSKMKKEALMNYFKKYLAPRYMKDVFLIPDMIAAAKANRQMLYKFARFHDIPMKEVRAETTNEVYAKIVKIIGKKSYDNMDSDDE